MYTLHIDFCAILFTRTQNLHFPKKSEKIVITAPPSKLCSQNYINIIFKISIQNFVRFHSIESELNYRIYNFRKKMFNEFTSISVIQIQLVVQLGNNKSNALRCRLTIRKDKL